MHVYEALAFKVLYLLQLRSTKFYRVSYGRPSPPSAKLISINPAAPERPSGKSFVLQVTGTFKFTPRKCCGELCLVSEDFGSLAAFEQTALTVGKAENIDGGQILRVATAEKLDVDTDLANNLLASGKLCREFRYGDADDCRCKNLPHCENTLAAIEKAA